MMGVFAEFERSMISERVKAGLARARSNGKRLGRPRAVVDVREVRRLKAQGLSLRAVGQQVGLSRTTVMKILAAR